MRQFRTNFLGTLFAGLAAYAVMATSVMPATAAEAENENPGHESAHVVTATEAPDSMAVVEKPILLPDVEGTDDEERQDLIPVVEATEMIPVNNDQGFTPIDEGEDREDGMIDDGEALTSTDPSQPNNVTSDADDNVGEGLSGVDAPGTLVPPVTAPAEPVEPVAPGEKPIDEGNTDEGNTGDDGENGEGEAPKPIEPTKPDPVPTTNPSADEGEPGNTPTTPTPSTEKPTGDDKDSALDTNPDVPSGADAEAQDDSGSGTSESGNTSGDNAEEPQSTPSPSQPSIKPTYTEAPVDSPVEEPSYPIEETRPPPIVGPPPDAFVLPPIPTMEEWLAGKKYMYQDCLDYHEIDDALYAQFLTGNPEYSSVFHFAWSCFKFTEYDQHVYPSYNRPEVPSQPGTPTDPETPPHGDEGEQPSSSPSTPPTPTVTLPATNPSESSPGGNTENNARPGGSSGVHVTEAPRRWGSQFENPVYEQNGVLYVRPWTPPSGSRGYQPLAVGAALNVMSSPTFADPLSAQAEAERLSPAGPDAMKLDDLFTQMGLTAIDIPWSGTGTALAIEGNSDGTGPGKKVTYDVQVEGLLPVDRPVFVSKFQEILDEDTRYRYQRRSSGKTDLTFVIASPSMTLQLCNPDAQPVDKPGPDTPEPKNCVTKKKQIVVNLRMWMFGESGEPSSTADAKLTAEQIKDLEKYRKEFLKDSVDKVFDKDK